MDTFILGETTTAGGLLPSFRGVVGNGEMGTGSARLKRLSASFSIDESDLVAGTWSLVSAEQALSLHDEDLVSGMFLSSDICKKNKK